MPKYTPMLNITPDPGNVNCRACQKYNIPGCESCRFCTSHCQCRNCEECKTRHPQNFCRICSRCLRAGGCTCGGRQGGINLNAHLTGKYMPRTATSKPLRRITPIDNPMRPISLELELSNYGVTAAQNFRFRHTAIHHARDGSIRSEGNPTEMIVGPIPGIGFEPAMKELAEWLRISRASVNKIGRAHV